MFYVNRAGKRISHFRDQLECEQAVGEALAAAVPEAWLRIDVDAVAVAADVMDLGVEYTRTCGEKRGLGYVPRLADYFFELRQLVSSEEKGLFKRCRFVLEPDGRFRAEFSYEEVSFPFRLSE
jgi:hypothetical protein